MNTGHAGVCRGSGPRRSRSQIECPPGWHSLELTGKELRS